MADHEVDQAFAAALRQANLKAQHRTFTGEALALSQKVEQLQQLVEQDQAQVDSLTPVRRLRTQSRASSRLPTATILKSPRRSSGSTPMNLTTRSDDLDRASGDNRS